MQSFGRRGLPKSDGHRVRLLDLVAVCATTQAKVEFQGGPVDCPEEASRKL